MFEAEQDLRMGYIGLDFKRYYQSQGVGDGFKGLGGRWRHSFTRRMDGYQTTPSYPAYKNFKSNVFGTPDLACTAGWSDIKTSAFRGLFASATAVYQNELCRIVQNGDVVANLRVHDTGFSRSAVASQLIHTISRPDGTIYTFEQQAGQWVTTTKVPVKLEPVAAGWQFTDLDDTVELYDATGKLLTSTTRAGWATTYSYNADNTLNQVAGPLGHTLTFSYDTVGRVATVASPQGVIAYRYDYQNNLHSVTYPDTSTRQYLYEDSLFPNHLTGIIDENNDHYASWAYDKDGRALSSEHAGGVEKVTLTYNADGTTTVLGSTGATRTYSFEVDNGITNVKSITGDQCTTCPNGEKKNRSYDVNGFLDSSTDWGDVTTRYGNYDAAGHYGCNVEGITADDTSLGVCAFDPVASLDARRIDYTYTGSDYGVTTAGYRSLVETITEPSVFVGSNKATTTSYDDFGNRLSETTIGFDLAGTPVSRTTTWQYTGPLNQLSFVDGPRADVNDYTYYRYHPNDISQPIGMRGRLKEIEDANGVLIRSNIQYTATGKVQSEARPNGLALTNTYYPGSDRLHTLTETSASTTRVTRWTYLATGEVASITSADGTLDATTLAFGYDDARRLTRITDGLGNYIAYTLDTEGNRTFEKTYDNTDALKKQLTQTFDIYNRLDTTAQANETNNPDFAPDGTLNRQTDGQGSITDYSYDALKRLTQVVQDQGGSDLATANATTAYDYDAQDHLTSVADPINGNTGYAYDDLGNLVSQTSPDTGSTGFSYDAAGNLIQKTDALGQTFIYSYDALNRLTTLDAPGTDDDITYRYDSCQNGTGRLCTVTYGSGTLPTGNQVRYQYNAFGDVIRQQGILYGYDAQGRVQTLDYPSGSRLTYRYDAAGQISQVDFTVNGQTQTLANTLSYAPFGPVIGLTYGNSLVLSQTLDQAYRLTAQTVTGVLERSYPGYDANGNRLSQTDTLANPSSFTYDALNRLDTASGPFGARDYDYDQNSNRTQLVADSVATSSLYEPNSNRLDTLGATDVLLDATGNTLNQGNWTYSYTPHNRLATATEAATLKARFAYNGLGQRAHKTNETTATGRHYLYGTNGELLAETDQEGNVLTEYLYLNGRLLALFAPDDDQDGISNPQEAEQGTLPVNTDSDGDGLANLTEWYQHGTDSQNPDSDGDGTDDGVEIAAGTSPINAGIFPGDGDINENGETNLGDLVLLYRFVQNLRTPTQAEFARADINQDGQLDVADILLLQKQLLQVWLGISTAVTSADTERPDTKTNAALWALNWLIKPAYALPGNSGFLYYVHNDPLGTPQALTDESGTTVWTADYDPFGKATTNEDPDGDGNSVTLNVRFPGQYYDQETGLHYNYFRYYDPGTGRYLTSDPIGLDGGLNTYAYVGGNPLRYTDPTGEFFIFNLGGGLLGAASGAVGGYIASGGEFEGLRDGALAGGLVGLINPFGAIFGGALSNTVGQILGNNRACRDDIFEFNYELIVASGFAGGLGSRLSFYLSSPGRSAFTHNVNQRLGSSSIANGIGGALTEGALGGLIQGLSGDNRNGNDCGKCDK